MGELSPIERKLLKARAHTLQPVVLIGNEGLSSQVLGEIERALNAHELIKVRAAAMDRHERERTLITICARTGAVPVEHIGKILVVYRKMPESGRGR